jgi:uncharacterized protein YlxW (UPF0749 family)
MSWPLAESHRRHVAAPPQQRRRTPRFVWVLTAAAFLCGGLLSAAGFAIGWKHEAQRGTSAESALVAATASVHALRAQLATERTQLASEQVRAAGLSTARRSAQRAAAKLQAKSAALQQTLASVGAASGRLGGDLDRITNELRALTSYVTTTPAGQLDGGYVQAQLSYLAKTVAGFRAAVAALTSP